MIDQGEGLKPVKMRGGAGIWKDGKAEGSDGERGEGREGWEAILENC